MSQTFPIVYLARHGETAWTITGQHTGRTDLPLTERGADMARQLGKRLNGHTFAQVFTSPCLRAVQTCQLAGFGAVAEIDRDLVEWDYGEYEGRLSVDILAERPGWQLFRDGGPGGESPEEVAARADRVVQRVRQVGADVLLFSSGHFLRMLAARWIGAEPIVGRSLMLSTASLSSLSHEHSTDPAIRLWNDTAHLPTSSGTESVLRPSTEIDVSSTPLRVR
jgi:broad specificity phosphatase PhoE